MIRTSRVLSPDGAWPDRWLSGIIEMRRVGLKMHEGNDRVSEICLRHILGEELEMCFIPAVTFDYQH